MMFPREFCMPMVRISGQYILDIFGRLRISCADACGSMDLSGLESGLYFAVAAGIDGGKIGTMKMVVLR
ncbi:MAG: hypothetical protein IPN29_22000 [Saprospiraceae bacterium]|nr:hypothetical protein [Saprospiraceae bacterium]